VIVEQHRAPPGRAGACEIRVRAEREAGEQMKAAEKAKGAAEPGTNRGSTRLYACYRVTSRSRSPQSDSLVSLGALVSRRFGYQRVGCDQIPFQSASPG
jgi:hypothetical protein